ncbi:DUF2061 domain-containing protein [Aquabacterium sp. A08]|uniref:DUF2061 domain-containing protein n=1 Tax=Aquabacterium sp. A08 TaxID=2718532 RepID=UPI00141F043D|nr:DUF2061 domain-containing protein [Aquabacterium sp. A08]NIC40021.1 DUF2061 domain-containing protein [Aquabacterium sp. A08]
MARLRHIAHTHRRTLLKTGSYYAMHMLVAAAVAYAVTGQLWAALTLSVLEPTVQAVAYFFHERAWARREAAERAQAVAPGGAAPVLATAVR